MHLILSHSRLPPFDVGNLSLEEFFSHLKDVSMSLTPPDASVILSLLKG